MPTIHDFEGKARILRPPLEAKQVPWNDMASTLSFWFILNEMSVFEFGFVPSKKNVEKSDGPMLVQTVPLGLQVAPSHSELY